MMLRRLLVLAVLVGGAAAAWFVLDDRGDDTTTAAATTTPSLSTTTTPATISVKAYFFRGAGLVPVVVSVPKTDAVASAALKALLAGPPSGYTSAIPAGTTLRGISTSPEGVFTADFSQELAGAPRTAQGQIVYTLTQFPTVQGVLIEAAGSPVTLSDGSGATAYTPVSREDYVDLTPEAPIFVEAPIRDSTVSSPVEASGTAIAFEATIAVDIEADGNVLRTEPITASAGGPERGDWKITLDLPPGDVLLRFYEPSAEDGSHLHETTVAVHVAP